MENFRKAKADVKEPADWMTVIGFLKALQKMQHNDPYIIQQLALATYKSEVPDKLAALQKAKEILAQLAPETSSDAETVGLWGAVHKRLWEESKNKAGPRPGDQSATRAAISSRTTITTASTSHSCLMCAPTLSAGEEAIADRVLAKRIRREVPATLRALARRRWSLQGDDAFWVLATKVEASFGLRHEDAERLKAEAIDKAPQAVDGRDHARADRQAEGAAVVSGGWMPPLDRATALRRSEHS